MLQPKIHDMFGLFPVVGSIQSWVTFSLQSNHTRVGLEAGWDHLDQTLSNWLFWTPPECDCCVLTYPNEQHWGWTHHVFSEKVFQREAQQFPHDCAWERQNLHCIRWKLGQSFTPYILLRSVWSIFHVCRTTLTLKVPVYLPVVQLKEWFRN